MHKRKIVLCFIMLLFLIVQTVNANNLFTKIDVIFNQMNLFVNGQKVEADNILYNGTTYVPLRKVAEMLGKDVAWDQATNSVNITDMAFQSVGNIQIVTAEGTVYIGEMKDNYPSGYGMMLFSNGDRYMGRVEKKGPGNCGIYTNTDEDYIYLVKQTEDKRISDGVFCDSEETMYIGRKENGRKNGLGILRFEESVFIGEWTDDNPNGLCIWIGPDNRKYIGEVENGTFKGLGIIYSSDGTKFVGEVNKNEHVYGIFYNKSGKPTLIDKKK